MVHKSPQSVRGNGRKERQDQPRMSKLQLLRGMNRKPLSSFTKAPIFASLFCTSYHFGSRSTLRNPLHLQIPTLVSVYISSIAMNVRAMSGATRCTSDEVEIEIGSIKYHLILDTKVSIRHNSYIQLANSSTASIPQRTCSR